MKIHTAVRTRYIHKYTNNICPSNVEFSWYDFSCSVVLNSCLKILLYMSITLLLHLEGCYLEEALYLFIWMTWFFVLWKVSWYLWYGLIDFGFLFLFLLLFLTKLINDYLVDLFISRIALCAHVFFLYLHLPASVSAFDLERIIEYQC